MIESVCMFTSLHLSYLTLKGTTVGGTGGGHRGYVPNTPLEWSMCVLTICICRYRCCPFIIYVRCHFSFLIWRHKNVEPALSYITVWLFAFPSATPLTVQLAHCWVTYHIYQKKVANWCSQMTCLPREESCSQLQINLKHNATQDSIFKPMWLRH